jgi:hypothetical protein
MIPTTAARTEGEDPCPRAAVQESQARQEQRHGDDQLHDDQGREDDARQRRDGVALDHARNDGRTDPQHPESAPQVQPGDHERDDRQGRDSAAPRRGRVQDMDPDGAPGAAFGQQLAGDPERRGHGKALPALQAGRFRAGPRLGRAELGPALGAGEVNEGRARGKGVVVPGDGREPGSAHRALDDAPQARAGDGQRLSATGNRNVGTARTSVRAGGWWLTL